LIVTIGVTPRVDIKHPTTHRTSPTTKSYSIQQVWWGTSIIPAVRRLRPEDCEFKVGLGYIARVCQKKLSNQISRLRHSSLDHMIILVCLLS
jgi:hypothetical protein